MKKTFFTLAAALLAVAAISCGSKESKTCITNGDKSKMDTLSYAYGTILGKQFSAENDFVKDFDLNVNTVIKCMKESATGYDVVVNGDTINEKTMRHLSQKFFNRSLQERITAAKKDSTGNTKVHNSEEERESISAFIGVDAGLSLLRLNAPMQLCWIEKGFNDVAEGKATMNENDAQNYIRYYMMEKVPAENKKASEAWLAEVEKEEGVQKTASGLLYKLTEPGDMSAKPTSLEDVVKVHYKGTTRTGKVFDSSYDRGATIDFPLNGVIKGWGEGLQLVGKGGKITLWIPSDLAYGARGAGADIGPNEALRFDIELFEVTPANK